MKILVSAGHSNVDPGAVANGYREADIAAEFRNLVAHELRQAGADALTDGEGSDNKPLAEAVKLAGGVGLAVEFHCNAAVNPQARGVESISLPATRDVSRRISAAIAGVLGSPLRGEQGWIDQSKTPRGRLAFVNAGGVIVELFFISNAAELATYQAKKTELARAVAAVLLGVR
ncbi:N-acetylmuramoyl-L-alanine amidase [Chromobacterium alkanivorans]|uniref:N-acetylmuramoyl-L-alanine amidase n=1 Tax=Chromobacterium alkanivorans TaxID=1071719 RepID=UPI0019682B8A|nr:N-acetylmuramoyl-L-alanine amidase [Chromobacterium alkanivorans]MBN3003343.1 N-acetylmuramoyl-L-alanine amidase [Chromobacterium alkanivorans]